MAGADDFYADQDRRERDRAVRRRARRDRVEAHAAHTGHARLRDTTAGRILLGSVAALALFTVIGLIALWPSDVPVTGTSKDSVKATVTAVADVDCGGPVPQDCRQIVVEVGGATEEILLGPVIANPPDLAPGDGVRVMEAGGDLPPEAQRWSFVSVDRSGGLILLMVALAIVAIVTVRLRGLLALVGVVASLALLILFLVPALLAGESPLLVALVGSLAVMFVTLLLTHGLSVQTLAAALGIGSTLLGSCLLALAVVSLLALDGNSSDLTLALSQQAGTISLEGLVVAGMVIAALGVLTDTAVTQASAVAALRRADPTLGPRALYSGAFRVGRDHLSATVHTLVLAYAGTALPLLLLMRVQGVGVGEAVSMQEVAEPIAGAILGCLALMAAVPITTGLAAFLVGRTPVEAIGDDHHGHAH